MALLNEIPKIRKALRDNRPIHDDDEVYADGLRALDRLEAGLHSLASDLHRVATQSGPSNKEKP